MWSDGTGNRSDLKHKKKNFLKSVLSSFSTFLMAFFLSKLQMSSVLRAVISEGQNVLVDGEDHFPATVSLLRPE